jgi:hypothetical protein
MRNTWMRVLAASMPGRGIDAANEQQTLEMVVCLDAAGRLSATSALPRCRLLRAGREEWSGTLRADEGRWVVHNDLGDDEPIRLLHVRTLRPGDHLRLGIPGGKETCFRVEQVVLQPHAHAGKLHAVRGLDDPVAVPPRTRGPQDA